MLPQNYSYRDYSNRDRTSVIPAFDSIAPASLCTVIYSYRMIQPPACRQSIKSDVVTRQGWEKGFSVTYI